ncbi:MAG: PIG-L family deacetylase, partial [Anaerolineales bacterium]|nr:PIG-L family deacetylase [Anaerolineales bacterium]
MRWIYLSPHLDDAVLSAGGLIYEQTRSGTPVEIWTFMCGVPSGTEFSPF